MWTCENVSLMSATSFVTSTSNSFLHTKWVPNDHQVSYFVQIRGRDICGDFVFWRKPWVVSVVMGVGSGCHDPGTQVRRLRHLLPPSAHSLTQRAFLPHNLSSDANCISFSWQKDNSLLMHFVTIYLCVFRNAFCRNLNCCFQFIQFINLDLWFNQLFIQLVLEK